MKEQEKGKKRNGLFYGFLIILLAGIIAVVIMGQNQDKAFIENSHMFNEANNKLKQQKFSEAEAAYSKLLKEHSDSYTLLWRYALALSGQEKYKEANQYFLKAREIRPFLLKNHQFLAQYGESLYKSGDYKRAERYLTESKQMSIEAGTVTSPAVETMLLDAQKKIQ
ncbi:tetratricopeptide repeat protein [Aneurinibacillus aneurinilyticus]|uniref:tetratricopeptide repeat protein n=1 Tax=Aneurinibacillus aneurinilyticus TaxID=1391 RepID=UPI002E215580|nr:tetratricopeptide repeat protein [Aneurinibacillus aneurinilyticus]